MIKSIVLFVTFLAVVVAHPQGLWGMAKDDPLLLDLSSQALKLYNSEPKNSVELVEISHARATRQKDRVRFVLEVKGQECEECSCSEVRFLPDISQLIIGFSNAARTRKLMFKFYPLL